MLRHSAIATAAEISMGVPTNNRNNALLQPLQPPTLNNHLNKGVGSSLDALPKQFVLSMKTLFDILDDRQTGFVKFSDIEKGWKDDGCKGLPRGVIESLRKVTPPSGLLSFERFCAGLKLCLLRNQTEGSDSAAAGGSHSHHLNTANTKSSHIMPQSSAPLFEFDKAVPVMSPAAAWNSKQPPHIAATQRTLSMPQLSPDNLVVAPDVYNSPPPPPKPPRASVTAAAAAGHTHSAGAPPLFDKAEIRHALQNWQMGVLLNEMEGTTTTSAPSKDKRHNFYYSPQQQQQQTLRTQQFATYRGCADGGSSSATDSGANGAMVTKKSSSGNKRREQPRRHTLQNGIDYNMLKRLKQFEEEREVLLLGLDAVEKAREWYLQQMATVQERIKYLGRMSGGSQGEQWSEVQQERLNFQRARVLEVNRNLAVLADTWERGGFPLQHFNLATSVLHSKSALQRSTTKTGGGGSGGSASNVRLRQQNRLLLSNEVKSDRCALLEREKLDLIEIQRMGMGGGGRGGNGGGFGFVSVLSQSSPVCSSSSGGLGDADVVY